MQFSIKSVQPGRAKTGCAVVGVFDSRELSAPAARLDEIAGGYVTGIVRRGDMQGKPGTVLLLHNVPNVACERVLLVGLGRQSEFGARQYREAVAAAVRALNATGAAEAELHLTALEIDGHDATWRAQQAVTIASETTYRFEQMKSRKEPAKQGVRRLVLVAHKADSRKAERGLEQGAAIALGMALTKDLGNLPPNICTPAYLADQARELGRRYRLKVQVLERADMQKLGMGALLSVAHGSVQPPKLIVVEYRGAVSKRKPIVLVGKGVTFDTGGISLKPAPEMDEMKFDMSGAGSVLGTLKAVAEMKLPIVFASLSLGLGYVSALVYWSRAC